MFRTLPNKQSGFTLVEMIVAIFIFTIVMLVATGALVTILDANRRAQANKVVMNNLHFVLESITREVRVGTNYEVTGAQGSSQFSFTDKDGCDIEYNLTDVTGDGIQEIVRTVVKPVGSPCPKSASSNVPITAREVTISAFQFWTYGTADADQTQPRVAIILRGIAGHTLRTQVPFNLQTTVTQRFLDR